MAQILDPLSDYVSAKKAAKERPFGDKLLNLAGAQGRNRTTDTRIFSPRFEAL